MRPTAESTGRAAAPGEEAVVFEAGFAIGEGGAGQGFDAAACFEDRLSRCGVPLHRRAEAGVHVGNGWFGGFLPTTAFAIVAATGNIYDGLWYPVIIAAMTLVIGGLFVRETRHVDIHHEA
jgi:hypothetical protein